MKKFYHKYKRETDFKVSCNSITLPSQFQSAILNDYFVLPSFLPSLSSPVVDEEVDPAVLLQHGRHGAAHLRLVADVAAEGVNLGR